MAERVSFAEAISEPLLLKKAFEELSCPQQVALKSFYGLDLNEEELRYWSIFQGGAEFDHLGYPQKITPVPYVPKEYQQAWAILGRRSGKTDRFLAFIIAYEAVLGGHEDYIKKGQKAMCFLVSQNLAVARENYTFVLTTLESSPLFKKEIKDQNADFIYLKNNITIGMAPPSGKALRGYAVPVVAMDEVGMWYTDSESANPDVEVLRAIKHATVQFPHRKLLGTSTPWVKDGLLWKFYEAGTEGRKLDQSKRGPFKNVLVLNAPTAVMTGIKSGGLKRVLVPRETLAQEYESDPQAFERESMARFVDSISGFLNAQKIKEAVSIGVFERPAIRKDTQGATEIPHYVAAMDPAFRRDAFAFCIAHNSDKGVVVDYTYRWKAPMGQVLNPSAVLDDIKAKLDEYNISIVYSDQYHLESLQSLALDRGFAIEGVPFYARSKAEIFGNLQSLLNSQKIHLLDWKELGAAKEMHDELVALERKITQGGGVQIAAPHGKHDDMAAVMALCAFKAVWMMPVQKKVENKEPSLFERCFAQIKRKRLENSSRSLD
jgi:hypothetical protein